MQASFSLGIRIYSSLCSVSISLFLFQVCFASQNGTGDSYDPNTGIIGMIKVKNYNKYERPLDGGTPVAVSICPHFGTLGIDDMEMEIAVSFDLVLQWEDPRLRNNGKSRSVSPALESKIWIPDVTVIENRSKLMFLQSDTNSICKVEPTGLVECKIGVIVKAACLMDMRQFPHDRHVCNVTFASYGYYDQDVLLKLKDKDKCLGENHEKLIRTAGFTLIGKISSSQHFQHHQGGNTSVVQMNFVFKRSPAIYWLQMYFPTTLSVLISWMSFWIHHEAVAARVALGITTILTILTLTVNTQDSLPAVPYSKEIDWYLCICFAYVVCALVEFVTVHYYVNSGWSLSFLCPNKVEDSFPLEKHPSQQDEKSNNLITSFHKDSENSEEQRTTEPANTDTTSKANANKPRKSQKRSRKIKLYSKIDIFSRYFFPATFLIFYLLYWFVEFY